MTSAGHPLDPDWLLRHLPKIRDNHGDLPDEITPEHLWLAAHGKPVIPHQVTQEEAVDWLLSSGAVKMPASSKTIHNNDTPKVVEKSNSASSRIQRKG